MLTNLRTTRTAQGLSQVVLGQRAGITGSAVSQIEAGQPPTLKTALALSAALGVTLEELIGDGAAYTPEKAPA